MLKDPARQAVKEWFLDNFYGHAPIARPGDMTFEGNSILFGGGKMKVDLTVAMPKGASKASPCPVLVMGDFRTWNNGVRDDAYTRAEQAKQDAMDAYATSRGYAMVHYNLNEAAPDQPRRMMLDKMVKSGKPLPPCPYGLFEVYGGEKDRTDVSWGTIRAWAWCHSRVMDWIEAQPALDARHVAVMGHSRLGKTAICAGVTDARFRVVYSNASGCCGAKLNRIELPKSEHIAQIAKSFPYWFCRNIMKWSGRDREVSHDQDEWMGLIAAPGRYLYVASGSEDAWAGPAAEKAAAEGAARAWEALGLKGMGGHVGYHCHMGRHDFTVADLEPFLDFCDRAFASRPAPVVFNTPANDEKGVMVLGNGEVGATAWLDAAGTLHTVLQNSDSWNEGGRHVKTGAIDYETGCAVDAGTYRQELSMERGEFEASWMSGGKPVAVRYRVQRGTDSIAVCDVRGAPNVEAKVVNWRLYPGGSKEFGVGEYELGIRFCEGYFVDNVKDLKFTISADRLVPGGWCHVNRNETVAELMKVYDYYQATGDLGKPDLLSDRVFGGVTRKITGTTGVSPVASGGTGTTGVSPVANVNGHDARSPSTLFLTAVTCLHPCKDEAEWLRRTNEMLDREGWTLEGEEAKRADHIAAWARFWDRSHITVTPAAVCNGQDARCPSAAACNGQDARCPSDKAKRSSYVFPRNDKLPLSFGVDSKGHNKFLGKFSFAEVEFGGQKVYAGVPKAGDAVATGKMPVVPVNGQDARSPGLFRFACRFTTDHLEKPQRIFDNMTPGGIDGFLIDIYRGRVRGIFGKVQMHHPVKVAAGRETAVEVRVSNDGVAEIVVDGKAERRWLGRPIIPLADECAAITTAYAAQRYLTACAGTGRFPIRFNGSLFTISHRGDPDYRRWGSGYWWQNTRLPYYPMFAAGDIGSTDPLFRQYLGNLDFFKKRTKKYFGHGGAYFPETMQPWGDHFIGSYGPECEWNLRKDKHQHHSCHKYAWVGQMELSLMAIMRWQHTQDNAWFKKNALPAIREFVRYFDEHYGLDAKGRYNMYPAQAVETWRDCTNPMTEVSGLTRVTDLLLSMPDAVLEPGDRGFFAKVRSRVPDLPTRKLGSTGTTGVSPVDDEKIVFAPAEIFKRHGNVETPELYCVFPFRLSSFEKLNAEIGRRTYTDGRFHKLYFGWAQDELNAAYLGMAEEAREHIVDRVFKNTPTIGRTIGCNEENIAERTYRPSEYRWPAYWGPNYNWRPDQDEGGVFQNTIQSMLMQYEGKKIFLLPAWPKDWNCDFKLHAPYNTTVEGRVENGELKGLVIEPAHRREDVVVGRLRVKEHDCK